MIPVFVPTRDRPEELRSCLATLSRHLAETSSEYEIVVLDNSHSAGSVTANTASVAELSSSLGKHIRAVRRIGQAEKREHAERVCSLLVHSTAQRPVRERVRRAVHLSLGTGLDCSPVLSTYGSNRNAGLLLAAGNRYLSLDDDVRVEFCELRERYTTRAGVCPPKAEPNQNPHERFCVTPLPAITDMQGLSVPSKNYTLESLLKLVHNASAGSGAPSTSTPTQRPPVLLAQTGICGNRWYPRASVGYWAHEALRDYSYANAATYKAALKSGYALLQVPELLVATNTFFATYCYAANAELMLPPFPPLGRSEDLSFALLTRYVYPEHATAHVPCMIRHDIGPSRPFSNSDFQNTGVDFGTATRYVIEHLLATALPSAGALSLSMLGRRMQQLSRIAPEDWILLMHRLHIGHNSALIHQLQLMLTQHGHQPSYWARDLESFIALLQGHGTDSRHALPHEFAGLLSPEEAATEHCRFLRAYGELLEYWPEIWNAAVQLNRSGAHLQRCGA